MVILRCTFLYYLLTQPVYGSVIKGLQIEFVCCKNVCRTIINSSIWAVRIQSFFTKRGFFRLLVFFIHLTLRLTLWFFNRSMEPSRSNSGQIWFRSFLMQNRCSGHQNSRPLLTWTYSSKNRRMRVKTHVSMSGFLCFIIIYLLDN